MTSELANQQQTQLEHCKLPGAQIWRNNSGACTDQTGRLVRYGLGNTSAQMNKAIKSSDLIGITPTLIEPHMVGYYLGVFTAYEIKPSGWTLRPGDDRGHAQSRFHDLVKQSCGFAGFVTDPSQIYRIIGRE